MMTRRHVLSRETVASRASAYAYGNVLVLAALLALDPNDLTGVTGVAYVIGTAISTFVAHLLADSVGDRIRSDEPPTRKEIGAHTRNSLPIVSSATIPTLVLVAAWLGWVSTTTALATALSVTIARMALFGWVIEHLRGERSTVGIFLTGIGLAVMSALVAGLKFALTH